MFVRLSALDLPLLTLLTLWAFCSCLGHSLEDELYCQLCKHLTRNQIAWSETKAWELLLICLFAVPVSAAFQSHLLNFVVRRRAQFQSIHDRNDEERSIAVLVNNVYNAIVAANFDVALIKQVRALFVSGWTNDAAYVCICRPTTMHCFRGIYIQYSNLLLPLEMVDHFLIP